MILDHHGINAITHDRLGLGNKPRGQLRIVHRAPQLQRRKAGVVMPAATMPATTRGERRKMKSRVEEQARRKEEKIRAALNDSLPDLYQRYCRGERI